MVSIHPTHPDFPPTVRGASLCFEDLGLIPPLLQAVRDAGHQHPTPIQERAIPHVLEGRDLLGCAQTGTGKTAAFVLPILQRLTQAPTPVGRKPALRVLVLSPTRELATQIGEGFSSYGRHTRFQNTVIFGGVGQGNQVRTLQRGVDVLVAAPGRLCDLMSQRLVDLSKVEIFVLDEADRMLDEGFLPAVRRILDALPARRQTLFFSATMPKELGPLADRILRDPVRVAVTPVASTPDKVDQMLYFVEQPNKRALLLELLADPAVTRAVVFTRTKHGADRLAKQLARSDVGADAIHGDKAQGARERALARFRDGTVRVLVATDVAARGIDIDGISHVFNFDLPNDPESYVHRIGRTARAGARGSARSFCNPEEVPQLIAIEKLLRRKVPVVADHPYRASVSLPAPASGKREGRSPDPSRHGDGSAGAGGGRHRSRNGAGRRSGAGRRPR